MNSAISAIRAQRLRRSTPIWSSSSATANAVAPQIVPCSGRISDASGKRSVRSTPEPSVNHWIATIAACSSARKPVKITEGGGRWWSAARASTSWKSPTVPCHCAVSSSATSVRRPPKRVALSAVCVAARARDFITELPVGRWRGSMIALAPSEREAAPVTSITGRSPSVRNRSPCPLRSWYEVENSSMTSTSTSGSAKRTVSTR